MYLVAGEALFDVFVDDESSDHAPMMDARAGGSPFNVAIGLARLGVESGLLTGMSRDVLGERLFRILESEGVSTRYLVRTGHRTTISLVGIDALGHPAYAFYGLGSADCSIGPDDLPEIGNEITGLHFGSYSLVVEPVANAFATFLDRHSDKFISLDPNVRVNVEPDLDIWRERIGAMIPKVDLLKVSAEDLELIYPNRRHDTLAADWISRGVSLVVVTDGEADVRAWTSNGNMHSVTPNATEVIDTVGAGDTFQAALLYKLHAANGVAPGRVLSGLTPDQLEEALVFSARAAQITCTRRGADLPRIRDVSPSSL